MGGEVTPRDDAVMITVKSPGIDLNMIIANGEDWQLLDRVLARLGRPSDLPPAGVATPEPQAVMLAPVDPGEPLGLNEQLIKKGLRDPQTGENIPAVPVRYAPLGLPPVNGRDDLQPEGRAFVRKCLERRGKSQAWLAREISRRIEPHFSQPALSLVLNGRRCPGYTLEVYEAIGAILIKGRS